MNEPSEPSESSENLIGGNELRSAVKSVFRILIQEGRTRLGGAMDDSKKMLALRALQKDKQKMYEKLGREVVRLADAEELSHPGLLRGVERIKDISAELETVMATPDEKNIDDSSESL